MVPGGADGRTPNHALFTATYTGRVTLPSILGSVFGASHNHWFCHPPHPLSPDPSAGRGRTPCARFVEQQTLACRGRSGQRCRTNVPDDLPQGGLSSQVTTHQATGFFSSLLHSSSSDCLFRSLARHLWMGIQFAWMSSCAAVRCMSLLWENWTARTRSGFSA
jgi:hypothetical protein